MIFSLSLSLFSLLIYFGYDYIFLLMSLKQDLIVKILEICKGGIAKSKIFESLSCVSESQIDRTLAYIVDNRLLQFTEANLQYITTHKGYTYLKERYKQTNE
jgi:hypothetical protein